MGKRKLSYQELVQMKREGKKFLTAVCYDYAWARLVDQTPIETIFCGDSMGMNTYGYESTNPVTMEQMIVHCQAVSIAGFPCMCMGIRHFLWKEQEKPDTNLKRINLAIAI